MFVVEGQEQIVAFQDLLEGGLEVLLLEEMVEFLKQIVGSDPSTVRFVGLVTHQQRTLLFPQFFFRSLQFL